MSTDAQTAHRFTFADAFAGCGGLSLGLMRAGWKGVFAIERDPNAFASLSANLLTEKAGRRFGFDWPSSIPQAALGIDEVLGRHRPAVSQFADRIDMLVGGPPCQGFSVAGRRDPDDPRNRLVRSYLQLVDLLRPRVVLIENVRGITVDFADGVRSRNYAAWLMKSLAVEYDVFSRIIDTSTFGVPQRRHRFFIIAIRKGLCDAHACPFEHIESTRLKFLESKAIRNFPVSARAAISDLEVTANGTTPSRDTPGFEEIRYRGPRTAYQRLMNDDAGANVTDTRLARHNDSIVRRFSKIIAMCHDNGRLNVSLSPEVRESFGLRKRAIRVLDPDLPSPTVTSMPDDLIHYKEPRCLTVRETARLQSFPDWFEFKGKYTTGGDRRKKEVPRFTQVANAVPPLVAEAIGGALMDFVRTYAFCSWSSRASSVS
jgi:DNA (cytosine-5)-methyltransferase 1